MDRIVAFIPARAGSKSIINKNIKNFAGKPLIHWSIEAALNCDKIDRVFVSTNGHVIANVANEIDNPRLSVISRSDKTATDTAITESAMLEFANDYDFDVIVLIQPTSPFVSELDLTTAITKLESSNADSLISVVKQKRFIWDKKGEYIIPGNYDLNNRPLRQYFEGFLVENGAFYITKKKDLLVSGCRLSGSIINFEMSEESYFEIDEVSDWIIAEGLMKNKMHVHLYPKNEIKLFATDVDGVLTDSGMYYSENGDEMKKFNTRDGKSIELLRKKDIKTAIITSEKTELVAQRAKKMHVDFLFQGEKNKLQKILDICKTENIDISNVAFIGDDLNDSELLSKAGFSACPVDAVNENKMLVDYVCTRKGGDGCVREFVELILNQQDT
jgi:N-acylneuraminate cytidylyltransferase|tara:strand:+ start:2338 stop:3498 length:1161 start_codon:yes stop_codon:yes gene_type:complete